MMITHDSLECWLSWGCKNGDTKVTIQYEMDDTDNISDSLGNKQ